jgi:hypothetical protein
LRIKGRFIDHRKLPPSLSGVADGKLKPICATMKSPRPCQQLSLRLKIWRVIQWRTAWNTRAPYEADNMAARALDQRQYRRRKRCPLTAAVFRETSDSLCCLTGASSCDEASSLSWARQCACSGAGAQAPPDARAAQHDASAISCQRLLTGLFRETRRSHRLSRPRSTFCEATQRARTSTELDWRA